MGPELNVTAEQLQQLGRQLRDRNMRLQEELRLLVETTASAWIWSVPHVFLDGLAAVRTDLRRLDASVDELGLVIQRAAEAYASADSSVLFDI